MAKANRETIKIEPDRSQLKDVYAAFRRMDDDTKLLLRDDVTSISAWTAGEMQSSYNLNPYPEQAEKVAATIRANKDKIPNVTIGGSKGRFSGGAVSGQILFGSEFGGPSPFDNGGSRFPARSARSGRGNVGYGIYATLKRLQPELTHRWKKSIEKHVLNNWSK